jgi:integral membrane protein
MLQPESLDIPHAYAGTWNRMPKLSTSLGRLRFIGWWEGVSFLVLLLIAMPLKYVWGWPDAVRVVGMAHGVLFVLYVLAAIQAAVEHDWPLKRTALVMVASVMPAGPFIVDARVLREEEARETNAARR